MRLPRGRAGRLALLVAMATALGALAQLAVAETVRSGNLIITIDGGISPRKLPRRAPAPISLTVSGSLKTADGSHPPALKTLFLQFDRHGHLNTKGLPTCQPSRLMNTLTAQAKRVCAGALIGSGRATAEIALPEQAPFSASGPILVFNGAPEGGKQVLVFHVYAHVPAPTTFVTTAAIGHSAGKYGTTALVRIPTIVAGQGSLTAFRATIQKTWTARGRRESLLSASCPTGQLYFQGEFDFANGEKLLGSAARSCTPAG